eukprot:GHVN01054996.1.p1 GENE.GHVN01054996.1~~GHVN01054996.1.p1  ORF type:complete len:1132 (+),score=180.09 GHVN01054996.1:185-3580(+)
MASPTPHTPTSLTSTQSLDVLGFTQKWTPSMSASATVSINDQPHATSPPSSPDRSATGGSGVSKVGEVSEGWKQITAKWRRPNIGEGSSGGSARGTFTNGNNLVFFLIDVDDQATSPILPNCPHDVSSTPNGEANNSIVTKIKNKFINNEVPVLKLYGVTEEGHSVLCHVHGFFPYLYAQCPPQCEDTQLLAMALEKHLAEAPSGRGLEKKIVSVEKTQKMSLLHYHPEGVSPFFKISVAVHKLVATTRTAIEQGKVVIGDSRVPDMPYEANIPFGLRFMIDTDVTGCSWIELPKHLFSVRSQPGGARAVSHCQIEVDVHYTDMIPHAPDGEWSKIPRLRILSTDIECITIEGKGFPKPTNDPVIQISAVLTQQGSPDPPTKMIFTLDECAPIPGAVVLWFSDEKVMLSMFAHFIRVWDPDVITGYNVVNFDLDYLVSRSHVLKVPEMRYLGRGVGVETRCKDVTFSSRAIGTHENKEFNIDGRLQLDVLECVRREYKLKSYTLNAVSAHFLKQQKEDVHYSIIGDLQRGTPETRRRIAVYCIKDAELPINLINKLMIMYNMVEMSRVTGTPINYLTTRGQQIKVTSQLLRKCRADGQYVMPSLKPKGGDGSVAYEGATVLEPIRGLYKAPIATLDFASLYPSIMMAHNLCFCSLVKGPTNGLSDEDITKSPTGDRFVKASVRKGILPQIVEELITARKRAKKEMEQATDELTKMVLNGRQLALKISANSVYGYTGATTGGQLPCLEVSTSITGYGREMIDHTKQMVESLITVANGYPSNAVVVYGDTDSVMIDFGFKGKADIGEAMRIGRDAAEKITATFIKPINLEFEKVFCPFLLMNKKRYAGLLYTKPDAYDKIDCKGIETVRRDFCLLVQQLVDTSLKKLLVEADEEGAKNYVKGVLADLLQNKIDMSLLVVSKSLGKDDYTTRLAHVELAKKLRQRDPATAPNIGDRVNYVIVKGAKGQPQYEKAEDPLYVLENGLPIDTEHYLDIIKNPIQRIFEGTMANPLLLFQGDHMRVKAGGMGGLGALSKFVKKSLQCLSCRTVITEGGLCKRCKEGKEAEVVIQRSLEIASKEKEFNELWTQCQRCQGSLHQEVICTSKDCPIYYRRVKSRKEIDALQTSMDRLDVEW